MYRYARATALAAMIVGIAGPACAQLPMSPAFRGSQPDKERPAAAAPATGVAAPAEAKSGADAAIVASVPIPPPTPPAAASATPSAAAESSAPPAAAKTAAVEPAAKRHASHRRRVYPRYRTAYQAAGAWPGAWGSSGSWHYGPNPYSANGGD